MPLRGWAPVLNIRLKHPPTLPLRPVIPNNTCPPRITAAAGTKLAGASFAGTFTSAQARTLFPANSGLHTEMLHPTHGVAASGFPPLRKIPYCCLPQESGPYLSPNVAGHPLRPATHRCLGGPLPRQLANGTRTHLKAHKCFREGVMPPPNPMRY